MEGLASSALEGAIMPGGQKYGDWLKSEGGAEGAEDTSSK